MLSVAEAPKNCGLEITKLSKEVAARGGIRGYLSDMLQNDPWLDSLKDSGLQRYLSTAVVPIDSLTGQMDNQSEHSQQIQQCYLNGLLLGLAIVRSRGVGQDHAARNLCGFSEVYHRSQHPITKPRNGGYSDELAMVQVVGDEWQSWQHRQAEQAKDGLHQLFTGGEVPPQVADWIDELSGDQDQTQMSNYTLVGLGTVAIQASRLFML